MLEDGAAVVLGLLVGADAPVGAEGAFEGEVELAAPALEAVAEVVRTVRGRPVRRPVPEGCRPAGGVVGGWHSLGKAGAQVIDPALVDAVSVALVQSLAPGRLGPAVRLIGMHLAMVAAKEVGSGGGFQEDSEVA